MHTYLQGLIDDTKTNEEEEEEEEGLPDVEQWQQLQSCLFSISVSLTVEEKGSVCLLLQYLHWLLLSKYFNDYNVFVVLHRNKEKVMMQVL